MRPYGRDARARGVKGTACNRDRVIGLQVAALVGHGTEALGAHGPLLNLLSRRLLCNHRIVQMYN